MTISGMNLINKTSEKALNVSSDDLTGSVIHNAVNLTDALIKGDFNVQTLSSALTSLNNQLAVDQDTANGSNPALRSLVNDISKSFGISMEFIIEREKRRNGIRAVKTETSQNASVKQRGSTHPSLVVEEEERDVPMDSSPSHAQNSYEDSTESEYDVSDLSDEENEEDSSRRSKKISVKNGNEKKVDEFPCNVCGKVFKWIESLQHHEFTHLPDSDPRKSAKRKFECSTCGKVLAGVGALSNHKKLHLDKEEDRKPYPCDGCTKRFHTADHLERHNRTHWPADDPRRRAFDCDICGKSLAGPYELKGHMRTHLDENDPEQAKLKTPLKCELCGEKFANKANLRGHMKSIHTEGINKDDPEKYPYKCNDCESRFMYTRSLKRHQKGHLANNDPRRDEFECFICEKIFPCKITLNKHKPIHLNDNETERKKIPFKCEVCGVTYSDVSKMKHHMSIHTGIAKLKCDVCNTTFPDSYGMNKHMQTKKHIRLAKLAEKKKNEIETVIMPMELNETKKHSAMDEIDEDITTDEEEERKPFKCTLCPKRYTRNDHLRTHMKSHSKNEKIRKPYKCEICERRYSQQNALKYHEKTHLPADDPRRTVSTFECEICGGIYKETSRNVHKRTHLGDDDPRRKKVECDECGLIVYESYLKRHLEIHLDEKDPVQAEMKRPFKCELCGSAFRSRHCLDMHKKCIHTNSNDDKKKKKGTYKCDICGYNLYRFKELLQHKKGHLLVDTSQKNDAPHMKTKHEA